MTRTLLALLLLGAAPAAQSSRPASAPAESLAALLSDPRLAGARAGVLVKDLEGNALLAAHDAEMGFMTASNMKLLSAATALLTLGPAFRFRTEVRARGEARDGVLHGDLLLVGAGDPSLGGRGPADGPPEAVMDRLAQAVVTRGVREITGDVLGDGRCQRGEPYGAGWSWDYLGEGYAAPVAGLCFAENIVSLRLSAPATGTAVLDLSPPTRYVTVVNEVVVLAAGKAVEPEVERTPGTNRSLLRGTLVAGGRDQQCAVAVHDAPRFAAFALREALERAGVRVRGAARNRTELVGELDGEASAALLAGHESAPLAELLVRLNKVSQNLYAEQLLRAAGRHGTGRADFAGAVAQAKTVLAGLGVDTQGLVLADGSGLTRLNLVRPAQLAALLEGLWRSPHRELFLSTLPVAGVDGTLRERFRGTVAQGRVRAKTGYISRVVALSGFVPRPDAQRPPLVFSILLNNFVCTTAEARAVVDRMVVELARHAGWTEPGK